MHVDIGDHAEPALTTMLPEPREGCLADRDLAGLERSGIDIVVVDEFEDAPAPVATRLAQEIRTTFTGLAARAAREL
jgi:hypothetical protein